MEKKSIKTLLLGSVVLLLAVLLGAFGAHGLKKILDPKYMATFQTGISYQYYHGFALLFLGLLGLHTPASAARGLKKAKVAFLLGILFFSGNCYLYALTKLQIFALLVPLGGISFILGWIYLYLSLRSWKKQYP